MAKPKKKYNPNKHIQRDPDEVVKNIGIFQLPGNKCNFVNMETLKLIQPPRGKTLSSLAQVFTKAKFEWMVVTTVFRINSKGEKVLQVEHLAPPFPCKADQVSDAVEEKYEAMIAKVDPKEFLAAGWLAIPWEEYISSVRLTELFDRLGVWDSYITNEGYILGEKHEN